MNNPNYFDLRELLGIAETNRRVLLPKDIPDLANLEAEPEKQLVFLLKHHLLHLGMAQGALARICHYDEHGMKDYDLEQGLRLIVQSLLSVACGLANLGNLTPKEMTGEFQKMDKRIKAIQPQSE